MWCDDGMLFSMFLCPHRQLEGALAFRQKKDRGRLFRYTPKFLDLIIVRLPEV